MTKPRVRKGKKQRGNVLLTTVGIMGLLAVGAASYVDSTTQAVRTANRQLNEIQTTHLCEAGVQSVLRSLWRPFKTSQRFTDMVSRCTNASANNPTCTLAGTIPGVGAFSAGVISFEQADTYTGLATVRAVGWIDRNGNGALDSNEPRKTVDVVGSFALQRSPVFDYTYFVNNYGWMDGFGANDLIVNGDMRANGNFNFSNGLPTVNGSVVACMNDKLTPAAAGLVNTPPVKWSDSTYATVAAGNSRMRQSYDSSVHGAKGSNQFENWRDYIFDSNASVVNNKVSGAVIADSNGTQGWTRTSGGQSPTMSMLDQTPTEEVIMPDLSDLSYYQGVSGSYVDTKATYGDGTANANFGQGAWVKVWDTTLNSGSGGYRTVSSGGVVSGSAALIGSNAHPIQIHGPVTFSQDCVIKGTVSGQGTIYTGRNVHIVGSIKYATPPDFRGNDMTAVNNRNEKADMLALAARGSVIMGDTSTFTASWPLYYMRPPFTHGRYDDNGNWIPPFDATEVDSTGHMKYQSCLSDAYVHSIAEGVNQMDCVMYTNFVGGGNIGTDGNGVTFNGSIISKDEAMVVFSLPMRMNYDNRIRESSLTANPLIDLQLPRSPTMLRSTWQDRGFGMSADGGGGSSGGDHGHEGAGNN